MEGFQKKKILVVGDIVLDRYVYGKPERISREAPIPVFLKSGEGYVPGGAANAAANLAAADQAVAVAAVVGKETAGETLLSLLAQNGIDTQMVLKTNRDTTVKTRFVSDTNQQVFRIDAEDHSEIDPEDTESILDSLKKLIADYDLVLLSDYAEGLMTFALTQKVITLAKECGVPTVVDVREPNPEKYRNAFLIKPNLAELEALTRMPVETEEEMIQAAESLRERCDCRYVLATCGPKGMILVGDGKPYVVNSFAREVYDVSGAGDTTAAYLCACLANGMSLRKCVDIANYAAGLQVEKLGTSLVYLEEVRQRISDIEEKTDDKIVLRDRAGELRKKYADKTIVFTNGCFDILHIGHVRYLEEASKEGDVLIVGLNSDLSVRRLKGESRPINREQDRAGLLSALEFVDHVVIFEEDTPYELIREIRPDVLVKGGDYRDKPEAVVGRDLVEANGGKVKLMSLIEGKSTTKTIEQIKEQEENANRPWGFFEVTGTSEQYQTKMIYMEPGGQLSLQIHRYREEFWTVVYGKGEARIGEEMIELFPGKTLHIPRGEKHRITNLSEDERLIVSELQLGDYFGEDDITRLEDMYGRA